MLAVSILRFLSICDYLARVAARFSEGCESVAELYQLNMSKILVLSRKAARRDEEMGYRDLVLFAPLLLGFGVTYFNTSLLKGTIMKYKFIPFPPWLLKSPVALWH